MAGKREKWRQKLWKLLMDYLGIFAGEQRFINSHRHKSSMIKEQDRYGHGETKD